MELSQDWRSFRGMFYPQRRSSASVARASNRLTPAFVVVDRGVVISAYADHEVLADWVGSQLAQIQAKVAHREIIAFERDQVDEWMKGALELPHFYDQIEALKEKARERTQTKVGYPRHFLLDALHGWWRKVLPSSYGIFIRVEPDAGMKAATRDLLIIVRRGKLEGFDEPDLTSLIHGKRNQPANIIKFLSERYHVPVLGAFVPASEWFKWAGETNPWREVARSMRKRRTRLMPSRWSLSALVTARAFFKV